MTVFALLENNDVIAQVKMFLQFCITDPDNEDDVLESTCIELTSIQIQTQARLGLPPVPQQPVVPWFLMYFKTNFMFLLLLKFWHSITS